MGRFIYTPAEAVSRFGSSKALPIVQGLWVVNTLVAVKQEVVDVERIDSVTCRPLVYTKYVIVGLSTEPIADIGKKNYLQPTADSRQYDLSGGYWGRNKLLPPETFTAGLKDMFYSYSGDRCNPVWCRFKGDLQSLAQSSLAPNISQSLPVAIRGEVHYRPVDLSAELASFEDSLRPL